MPGDRTEQATPKRREKAREEGDILHSRELTGTAGTLAGVLTLGVMGSRFLRGWRDSLRGFLELGSGSHWGLAQMAQTSSSMRRLSMDVLGPIVVTMGAVVCAAVIVGMAQTGGLNVHPGTLAFRINRVSPLANAKNLVSWRTAGRLGKSLLPVIILGALAWRRIHQEFAIPPFSTARLVVLGADVFGLLEATAWLMFVWALVDYVLEWRTRETRLKMSKQDLRDEMKQTEGSPQIRSRIRGLQRQMRRRKVKADVSRAAVVITNPTHYAVALGFDFHAMEAPRVLAKGRNLLAEEIKAEARWAGVPIVENPPLARSLYRTVEAGTSIPVTLYAAVAAILAYLYRQRVEAEVRERRAREAANQVRLAAIDQSQPPQGSRGKENRHE